MNRAGRSAGTARQRVTGRCAALLLLGFLAACTVAPPVPVVAPPTLPPPVAPPAPLERAVFAQSGLASLYGPKLQGHRTASGEPLHIHAMTAAHRNLPFQTIVRVTSPSTGKMVKVRINDRGPFISGRIIDLSEAAALALVILELGTAPVRVEVLASAQQ